MWRIYRSDQISQGNKFHVGDELSEGYIFYQGDLLNRVDGFNHLEKFYHADKIALMMKTNMNEHIANNVTSTLFFCKNKVY